MERPRFESGGKTASTILLGGLLVCLGLFMATAPLSLAAGQDTPRSTPQFDSISIDALDPGAWNGLVFLAHAFQQPASFALRIGSRSSNFLDGPDIFKAVAEVGPHAPDGSYCRMAWRQPPLNSLITLEWSRIDESTVVGRLTAPEDVQMVIESYFPFPPNRIVKQGLFSIDASKRAIEGERYFDGVFDASARWLVMIDRPTFATGTFAHLDEIAQVMNATGRLVPRLPPLGAESTATAAGLEFSMDALRSAHFVATLGWNGDALDRQARSLLEPGRIDGILKSKAVAYIGHRPSLGGLFEGAAEALSNSLFWNTVYIAPYDLAFPAATRAWAADDGWVVFVWDNFFAAMMASQEDGATAAAGVKSVLLGQTASGLVPNMASGIGSTPDRSQPPVGSYCVWKVYERTRDRSMLEWAYPRLKKWHGWWFKDRGDGQPWRDGNRDGLLEWGSDKGSEPAIVDRGVFKAPKWESGMDDSPMFDDAGYDEHAYTMKLTDVGLNSYYTLDAECLSKLARILGREEDSRRFAAEYETMKQRVRERLWNDADGLYENRRWNGEFSKRMSPTNFYPLLAGIATPEQAKRMVAEHLLNPNEFWGEFVVPSIARNDPAFSDQFYWRGSIWAASNYLVYLGLDRYRFDQEAFELAAKSYRLFMADWNAHQRSNENYLASGGNAGGDPHYTWSALLCQMAIDEYATDTPWDGLRFGILNPSSNGELRRMVSGGHLYDVAVGPTATTLTRDGKQRFEANAGVIVRHYRVEPTYVSFTIKSTGGTRLATAEFEPDNLGLKIDGRSAGKLTVHNGRADFEVPAGQHDVKIDR
jgi:hypothetical protein